jgi:release factor glutamine methyltransferase
MSNIAKHLSEAAAALKSASVAEPRRESNSLLAFALRRDKTFLVAHPEYELTEEEQKRFGQFVARRGNREPFQYITGRQEFYGLEFFVTPDVLIPRPETEIIVEKGVEYLKGRSDASFCDVGTGSGCISVALLNNLPCAYGTALDISAAALEVARANAEANTVSDRLILRLSDVFSNQQNEQFDLVVSNPPYIPRNEMASLQTEVRKFEPPAALTDGADGLSIVGKIINESPRFLRPGGLLLIEIGIKQDEYVIPMFSPDIWETPAMIPDLQSIPRVVRAQLHIRHV